MSEDYHSSARVDEVMGPMGPLYFAKVTIEGTPVDGMVDPGLFATNMCFDLFKKAYSQQCPEVPHVTLRDYSQNHSYWGPSEHLTFRWEGMYRDAHLHCHGCLPCAAYRGLGPKARTLLKPEHS